MRCIDVDALIEFIENRYNIIWKDDYEGGIKDACVDILEEINKMPTIEPERKTGRWIAHPDDTFDEWFCCSVCHKGLTMFDGTYNFCPNCGADMREDGASNADVES